MNREGWHRVAPVLGRCLELLLVSAFVGWWIGGVRGAMTGGAIVIEILIASALIGSSAGLLKRHCGKRLRAHPPELLEVVDNEARMSEIMRRKRAQTRHGFAPGSVVLWRGERGVIDCEYVDLRAAAESCTPSGWYENQERPPKTPPSGRWFSVVLAHGAVLAGELDLEPFADEREWPSIS